MNFCVSLHAEFICEAMCIKQSKVYFAGYGVLFIAMVGALLLVPKGELHLWLNGYHNPFLNGMMRAVTYLAQWPLYVIALLLFGRRYCMLAYYALSELTAAAVVQLIKHLVNMPRPLAFFGDNPDFQQIIVEGIRLHQWHSFPSGHSQTFFVFFTILVILYLPMLKSRASCSNQEPSTPISWVNGHRIKCSLSSKQSVFQRQTIRALLQLLAILLAALGAYSRIYLSQHFLLDVCVGSCIGVVVPILLWPVYNRMGAKWGDRGFFTNK